jgi:hypothetical protein
MIVQKNNESEATGIFYGERLTEQDPLVRLWGVRHRGPDSFPVGILEDAPPLAAC